MDGWRPAELALASYEISRWIAELFEPIEEGEEWPQAVTHAQIAYLEKEGSKPGEAMSYRPITISSPMYRVWAAMRLRDMEQWISTWALPEMYAGIPGQGAIDAWFSLLLELELKEHQGTPYCGGDRRHTQLLRTRSAGHYLQGR